MEFPLLSRHAVRKTCFAGRINDRDVKRRVGDSNQAKVVIPLFIDQILGVQGGTGRRLSARSGGKRTRNKLVKIRCTVLIQIVDIRLHLVDITGQEHHVLHLFPDNRIDDHLPFPFEPCSICSPGPAIVPGDPNPTTLWNGQRHAGHNDFPRRG